MKYLLLFALLTYVGTVSAQSNGKPADDLSTIEGTMNAVYDVISGDAGAARDWDRFRSLFYKDARLIPSGKNAKTGIIGATSLSPDDYVKRASPMFAKEGFFERETARRVEQYGNIAHVFSTYESRHAVSDKTPFSEA